MLQGKTALVTGSTSGIGLGIAKALAAQGANIVLNGFGDVEGPKAEVAALGVQVAYHGADMAKPAEIEAMMAAAQHQFGRVDILVNNAGIQHVARIEQFPVERWDAIIAINLSSAFHCHRAWPCPRCRPRTGAASSTWPRCTAWWLRQKNQPMWRPSTAWWA